MWICSKCEHQNPDNQSKCDVCGIAKPSATPQKKQSLNTPKTKWYHRPLFYIFLVIAAVGVGVLGYYFAQTTGMVPSYTDNAAKERNNSVTFLDPNFESIIRQIITKPTGAITQDDVKSITKIDAFNCGIYDISGIENFKNLEILEISDNHITDISALSNLSNLKELYLSDNGLSNIDALNTLTNLSVLSIENNQISDVSAIAGLTNLATLYLTNNPIIEYSPLLGIFSHLQYRDFSMPDNKGGNSANGGIFSSGDGAVVFGGDKLYLLNESLSEGSVICEDIGATDINIQDGWIYYCIGWDGTNKAADSYLNLYRIKTDGTSRQLLSSDECISVHIVGDYIYYSNRDDNFSIYRIKTDGTGREKLNSYDSVYLCVTDTGIYYINRDDDNAIYQISLDGGEGYKLGIMSCASLQIYNGSLYLISENDGCIYSVSLESELTKLVEDSCECFNISDGWIYYSNNSDGGRLYKVRLDGFDKQKLNDEETSHSIHIIGNYIIYAYSTKDSSGNWVWHGYYMMNKDGSDKQKLPDMFDPNEVIEFSDHNLSDAIRKQLQISSLNVTFGDVMGVTQLTLDSKNITNIAGLQYFRDLEQLDLGENKIKDISPLYDLTNLVELDLGNNNIEDISALQDLVNLEQLQIYSNKIKDIRALSNLKKLWYLLAVDNNITDITSIANLVDLTVLGLEMNQISDISALRKLTKLDQLWLNDNKIMNIEVLEYLPELRRLFLSNNLIEDISPLAGLEYLELLYLANNPIQDYSPIEKYYDRLSEKDFVI